MIYEKFCKCNELMSHVGTGNTGIWYYCPLCNRVMFRRNDGAGKMWFKHESETENSPGNSQPPPNK